MVERTDILKAVERAVAAEEKARLLPRGRRQTEDPGGAAMFHELAEFEKHHRDRLEELRANLRSGGAWIHYRGRTLPEVPAAEAAGRAAPGPRSDALEALRLAIAAEERAQAEYEALAQQAEDEAGRQMFSTLAEEEAMHRKLLDDQYYALSNRGVWLWGD